MPPRLLDVAGTTLLQHHVKYRFGRVPRPVDRLHLIDQILEQVGHRLRVRKHYVDVAIFRLQCQAVPGVKGQVLQLGKAQAAEVLAEDPEAAGRATIHDTSDVGDGGSTAALA